MIRSRRFVSVLALLVLTASPLTIRQAVAAENPIPFVNNPLVPNHAAPESAGFTLTVNGANFVSGSVVSWNGVPLSTSFISADQLQADVPNSDLTSAGTASVTVSSGGIASNIGTFTVAVPTTSVTFARSTKPVGTDPTALVVADLNKDGHADLAVVAGQPPAKCSGSDASLLVLLGNGLGAFPNKSTLCFPIPNGPAQTQAMPALLAGDFNNDGNIDLLGEWFTEGAWYRATFAGAGDGTFANIANVNLGGSVSIFATADLNRNGNLDFVESIFYGGQPNVLTPGGLLSPANLQSNSLTLGDFNNDGILDIASVGLGSQNNHFPYPPVSIFLGNGDGSFTAASVQPSTSFVKAQSVTAADFDGDGILDLAVADSGSNTITILKGKGDGTFTQVSGEPSLSQFATYVTSADLNGDGNVDLVFVDSCGSGCVANKISIFLGNGDGTFQPELVQTVGNAPQMVGIGDFNGDGRLDLAVTNSADNTISILKQTVAAPKVAIALTANPNPSSVGQSVTLTATVTASPFAITGTITFKKGSTVLGSAPLVNGQASINTSFPKAGTFSIVASYSGDQNYSKKNSNIVKQVVNP